MDKIAVIKEYQGNGLFHVLWGILESEYVKLIWRCKKYNPINEKYEEKCDLVLDYESNEWIYYFKNLDSYEIYESLKYMLGKNDSFE